MTSRMEPISHEVMQGKYYEQHVTYEQETIKGFAWRCDECRLVWEKRWQADSCSRRKHAAVFQQRYGGRVENGEYRGGKSYTRRAIRRDTLNLSHQG